MFVFGKRVIAFDAGNFPDSVTGLSCSLNVLFRWVNILDEKVKDSPWTLEEDEKLLKGVREIGKGLHCLDLLSLHCGHFSSFFFLEWARIAVTLPGRTGDHCKSRFRSLMISKVKVCFCDIILFLGEAFSHRMFSRFLTPFIYFYFTSLL